MKTQVDFFMLARHRGFLILRCDMSLSGVNNKCAKCIQKCKQWNQVKVIICPLFKSIQRQARENGGTAPSLKVNQQIGLLPVKQEKGLKSPLNAKSMADRSV